MKKKAIEAASSILLITSCLASGSNEKIGLYSENLDIIPDLEKKKGKENYLDCLSDENKNTPNILIITADDLGHNDLPCYSKNYNKIKTPNIEALAKSGVQFTNGYASAPICAPSRAGLVTGRDQNRFGFCTQPMRIYAKSNTIYNIVSSIVKKDGMRPIPNKYIPTKEQIKLQGLPHSEITFAEMLRARGYATGMFGKWHMGYEKHNNPIEFGFDQHYGFVEAYSLFALKTDPSIIHARVNLFSERHIWRGGRKKGCAILRNEKVIKEKRYLTDALAEETIKFIENSKNQKKPFFAFVPFNAPHTPFQAKKSYYQKLSHIKDHKERVYLAMILSLDEAVGSIVNYLENKGLRENTLIFFSSDNGGATYTRALTNDPLKGGKFSLWEGGIKVPYIVSWKGQIKPNQVIDTPVHHHDIFKTIATATKTPISSDRKYDGINLLPLMTGKGQIENRKTLYWQMIFITAIREDNWKLIHNSRENLTVLYNLANDPSEKKNLFVQNPEKAKELLQKIKKWQKETKKPLWPYVMEYNYRDEDENQDNWYPL